jgi:hypothetical protein
MTNDAEPCDLFVLWGVRRQDYIRRAKSHGSDVCVLERSYLADRFTWTSVSFGGELNGRAEFRTPQGVGLERFESFGLKLTPWCIRPDGYALIIGQVPGDQSIKDVDINSFYRQTAEALRRAGHQEVYFRAHPQATGRRTGTFQGVPTLGGDLAHALAGAKLVLTWNSNTGVDAALAGRPVVAMDPGSMVWDIAGHQVDEVRTPDRTAWASRLAWCQFTKAEMESGFCQEAVGL